MLINLNSLVYLMLLQSLARDSVNQKNLKLSEFNDHKLNLEEYTKKLEHYAAEQKAKDKEVMLAAQQN